MMVTAFPSESRLEFVDKQIRLLRVVIEEHRQYCSGRDCTTCSRFTTTMLGLKDKRREILKKTRP